MLPLLSEAENGNQNRNILPKFILKKECNDYIFDYEIMTINQSLFYILIPKKFDVSSGFASELRDYSFFLINADASICVVTKSRTHLQCVTCAITKK